MTKDQWIEYLTNRAKDEGVYITLSGAELYGWLGGVNPDDDPDSVWEGLKEALQESA